MQLWRGTQCLVRAPGQPRYGGGTSCQHHGQQAHDEHPSVWNVQLPSQPHGDSRDGGSAGGLDTDALYSRNGCTLDARLSLGPGGGNARTAELF